MTLYSVLCSHTILVIHTKRYGDILTGTPDGGIDCNGYEIAISDQYIESHTYNGRPIESRISNGTIFNDPEQLLTQFSRSCHSLTLNISQTAKDTAIVVTKCESQTVPKLWNRTISND